MACVLIFIFGTTFSLMWGGEWYGSPEQTIMKNLTGYTTIEVSGAGTWDVMKLGGGFLTHGLPTILMWDYPYLNNLFGFFVRMILLAVTCGVLFGVYEVFAPIIQGVFGWIRGLF